MLIYAHYIVKIDIFINPKNHRLRIVADSKRLFDITYELVGEDAVQVVECLYENPGYSEFDINEKIGLTVGQIRSILYELKSKNLIDYDRRKDKEKGWYLYYWRVLPQNFETVYRNEKKIKLGQFKERLENEETSIFYICPNFCKRLSFEGALESNFSCPVCSSLMNEENKEGKIEALKRNIREHEEVIGKSNSLV